MPKSRLSDVLDTIAAAVNASLASAGLTGTAAAGRVEVGWPNPNYLGKRMKANQPLVTVFPTPRSTNSSRYLGTEAVAAVFAAPTCFATISTGLITLSGSITPGLNCHIFTIAVEADALVQTVAGDTLVSVATKIAAAINALDYPDVVATVSGETVNVANAPCLAVNIGESGTGFTETGRRSRDIQVTVWAPDDASREAIGNAIMANIGTETSRDLILSDGTSVYIEYKSDTLNDSMEDNLTTYILHIIFDVDYGVLSYTTATQIGSVITGLSFDSQATSLSYDSGD